LILLQTNEAAKTELQMFKEMALVKRQGPKKTITAEVEIETADAMVATDQEDAAEAVAEEGVADEDAEEAEETMTTGVAATTEVEAGDMMVAEVEVMKVVEVVATKEVEVEDMKVVEAGDTTMTEVADMEEAVKEDGVEVTEMHDNAITTKTMTDVVVVAVVVAIRHLVFASNKTLRALQQNHEQMLSTVYTGVSFLES